MRRARFPLAFLPTPVHPLPRLGARIGLPGLWIKRDDLTGLAFGGNKTRKLELLVAEARHRGAHTLVTVGAAQSNHCRQTAAAAASAGLACVVVLRGAPRADRDGNLLLDHLLGAEVVWAGAEEPLVCLDQTVARLEAEGRRPFGITYGGSTALGASAYADAMAELGAQGRFDRVVVASSSGGTQAGMVAGARLHGFSGRVTGISIDEEGAALKRLVAELASGAAAVLGSASTFTSDDVEVEDGYLGGGYGIVGEAEREALGLFAREEGILLDPVYTARAAAGMIDMIRRGRIDPGERVLFWHTGGQPALFPYRAELGL